MTVTEPRHRHGCVIPVRVNDELRDPINQAAESLGQSAARPVLTADQLPLFDVEQYSSPASALPGSRNSLRPRPPRDVSPQVKQLELFDEAKEVKR